MSDENNKDFRRVMRSMAVYLTLLDLGLKDFEKIRKKIYENYGRTISDCYKHPEYLKTVLEELYGDKSKDIVNSIEASLGNNITNIWNDNLIKKVNEIDKKTKIGLI